MTSLSPSSLLHGDLRRGGTVPGKQQQLQDEIDKKRLEDFETRAKRAQPTSF